MGLQNIKLPCKMRKKGRSKGADNTVIGLPIKKARGSKLVPFLYVHSKENLVSTYIQEYISYCALLVYYYVTLLHIIL